MWTQEAYRPRCIKYSICCPVLGGVPLPCQGYPTLDTPIRPGQGVPRLCRQGYLRWDPPGQVWQEGAYPIPSLAGVPPCQVWWGVSKVGCPPARSDRGYLRWGMYAVGKYMCSNYYNKKLFAQWMPALNTLSIVKQDCKSVAAEWVYAAKAFWRRESSLVNGISCGECFSVS